MDRFEAMQAFCKVVEQGSFAAAAERLDISTSAVSRLVAQLEAHLQARLLNRTTRRTSLTDDGRAYYERCLQLIADLEEAEELVAHTGSALRGTLRLTASIGFGIGPMAGALAEFSRRNPALKIDTSLSDNQVDLVEAGLDMGIRIGQLGSQNVVARTIGRTRILMCASAGYLAQHGTPQTPEDMAQHNCFTYAYTPDSHMWRFQHLDGRKAEVRIKGTHHGNNSMLLRELACQDLGIVRAPDFILQSAVDRGELVELLPDWTANMINIYVIYPSRRHLSAKVRGFANFLQEWLARDEAKPA
ncbi:LysR family transcriptional regulator [Uliginosibacterium sediminicola]|uniref:LysR family transcriptional regulator n=1 Tax=Uliginosibacterium sediminicola TaxID=2024550 RepID=A0ABU9Z3N0_9RHOO